MKNIFNKIAVGILGLALFAPAALSAGFVNGVCVANGAQFSGDVSIADPYSLKTNNITDISGGMITVSGATLQVGDALFLPFLSPNEVVATDGANFLTSLAYDPANTSSAIVQRDGSGDFSAGTITASLDGNANTVTNGVYTTDIGTVTNTMLAGSIANNKLVNSSITLNGVSVSLGGSDTISAATPNPLTISTGLQLNSGSTFDGSSPKTLSIDNTVATLTVAQALTNKTISGASNTLSNIGNSSLTNSSVTANGTSISLGSSGTVPVNTTSTVSNASFYPLFVASSANGNQSVNLATGWSFNPSTNTLTTTTFNGALTGNASTVTNGVYTSGSCSDPSWITSLAGSKISGAVAQSDGIGTSTISTNASYYPLFVANNGTFYQSVGVNGSLNYNPSTGTLTAAAFSGNASSATNIGITNDTTTNATMYPLWVTANTGNLPAKVTSTKLSFNPSTGVLNSTGLNLLGLTASQAVVTDGSKNLASLAYTNANTASTLVQRDGSGNFSAGTISAAITGNASTATALQTARNINNTSFDGSASITLPAILNAYTVISGTSQSMVVNNGYTSNNASLVTFTLPSTCTVGDEIQVTGLGAGGWEIDQNVGQIVHFGSLATTTGTGGKLDSTNRYDSITERCVVTNTTWDVTSSIGNITVT